MKDSIYFRIFIATALIVLLSISLLGGVSTIMSYRRSIAEKRAMMSSTLYETSRYITTQHIHYAIDLSDLNMRVRLAMTSGITGFDLLVTDAYGVVESCSSTTFDNIGKYVGEDILQLVNPGETTVIESSLNQIYPENRQVMGTPLLISIDG